MKRILLLAVASLFFNGCVTGAKYAPTSRIDKFNNSSSKQLNDQSFGKLTNAGCKLATYANIENRLNIGVVQFKTKSGKFIYWLRIVYSAPSWIFIEKGESLKFLLDGKKMTIKTDNPSTDVISGAGILEQASYDVTLKQLKKIANAKLVEVRLSGSKGYVEGCLPHGTQQNIRRWLVEEIGASKVKYIPDPKKY